jgi:hypothetical protein
MQQKGSTSAIRMVFSKHNVNKVGLSFSDIPS